VTHFDLPDRLAVAADALCLRIERERSARDTERPRAAAAHDAALTAYRDALNILLASGKPAYPIVWCGLYAANAAPSYVCMGTAYFKDWQKRNAHPLHSPPGVSSAPRP
jgi:hypothetical protein